jgi:hypothetical protein
MEQNKTGKYLKYAIGEILLVVIGILIALQINNWNEDRQLKKVEKSTIEALISEFESNKISIQLCVELVEIRRLFGDSLRRQLGPEQPSLAIYKMNKWFGEIGATNRCAISISILEDIQSSGNLKIIENEEIGRNISKWSSELKKLEREEEDWASEFSNVFYPYTNKWISWDDIDNIDNVDNPHYFNSRFKFDPRLILQQFEFSNIMAVHTWRMRRVIALTTKLLEQTEKVLGLMQEELK